MMSLTQKYTVLLCYCILFKKFHFIFDSEDFTPTKYVVMIVDSFSHAVK